MHKLQAGIEPSLTVFPQPPVLLQPRKAALNHPALGYHRKLGAARCAWPSAPSPLRPTLHAHPVQKALPCARCRTKRSALRPDFPCSACSAPLRSVTSAVVAATAWEKPCRIDCNVALDPRDFLARVTALEARRVCVLDASRVNDQERRAGVSPQLSWGRANLVFLKPAPTR